MRTYLNDCIRSSILVFLTLTGLSQTSVDPKVFYKNVVEIGYQDFGLITGDDSKNVYFICVRNAMDKVSDNKLDSIRFYRSSFVTSASRVKNFSLGAYQVILYQCEKDPANKWQKKYFGSASQNMLTPSTFLDNGAKDSLWSASYEKIEVHEILGSGQLLISVPTNSDIERGMPLISANGFIGGIFAEKGNSKKLVSAINMKEIAEQLYLYSDCRYFNMVEFGQPANRCEMAKTAKRIEQNHIESEKPEIIHLVDFGIFASIMGGTAQPGLKVDGSGNTGTSVFNYGISFYLNIDPRNYQRLTIKLGYGKFNESFSDGIWKSPDNRLKMIQSRYKFFNIPIVYELEFYRSTNFSGSVGLGYGLSIARNQWLIILNNNLNQNIKYEANPTAFAHRLIAELHFFEWELVRIGLIFGKDIGKFPNSSYSFVRTNTTYKPFEGRTSPWYFGLEASVRLRGVWGLREH